MSAVPSSSEYDTPPERAIEEVFAHEGPLLVDFDETLYLRNSTEDFIDVARPGLLATLLLRTLEVLRPWKLTGGSVTRDSWRVGLVWLLLPWTRARWRRQAQALAQQHTNEPLRAALLSKTEQVVIVTAGFHPIIAPLVAAMGFTRTRIVAARLGSFRDRRRGKLHAAVTALGAESVQSSLVVTDSLDDLPLLAKCTRPLRTIWPGARFQRALAGVYLPGDYISQVKRPGEGYLARVILQEDFSYWVLATAFIAPNPWLCIAGLAFLLASFWVIYERGYVDNDWAAAHLEQDGKLHKNYWRSPVATPAVQPWIWAFALGGTGVCVLDWPDPQPWDLGRWLGVLVFTYGTFKVYNRVDKSTRVWLYAVLQLLRTAAFVVLVPIPPISVAALGAMTIARWMPYYVYRLGTGWPKVQEYLSRLMFFVLLAVLLVYTSGPEVVLNWTAPALLVWSVIRARKELLPVLRGVHRLRRARVERL